MIMLDILYPINLRSEFMEYRDLEVWHRCHQLTLALYKVTTSYSQSEHYELISQLRRSVTAIPGHIAEGCGRGRRGLAHSLRNAMGSASELDYLLLLARDLEILPDSEYERFCNELVDVKRMVTFLVQGLEPEW